MRKASGEGGEWVEAQNGLLSNKSTKINIENLETCKKYEFRIAAINKAGPSQFQQVGPTVCADQVGKHAR